MKYHIFINKGLNNERILADVYTDIDQAIAMVNRIKKFSPKVQTVCTGFYKNGRFVKMYFTGPLELI